MHKISDEVSEQMVIEYDKVISEFEEKVKDKLEAASKAVKELEDMAEEYGVPVDFNGETFVPSSFKEKFSEIDFYEKFNMTGATYRGYDKDHSGWMNSSSGC